MHPTDAVIIITDIQYGKDKSNNNYKQNVFIDLMQTSICRQLLLINEDDEINNITRK